MSLYLGKIHYWLFNKMKWFEVLEKDIIVIAKSEGLDVLGLSEEINNQYGEMLPNLPLEDVIDVSNIHGWLQRKIHSAEGRMAAWTKVVLETDKGKVKLEKIYIFQGVKAANEVKNNGKELSTAVEIYSSINDYILDGMPCDRVNEIIRSDDFKVQWKRRICVHSDIWEKEGVDVKVFYELRTLWIKAFVTAINSDFHYDEKEDNTMVVENSISDDDLQVYEL